MNVHKRLGNAPCRRNRIIVNAKGKERIHVANLKKFGAKDLILLCAHTHVYTRVDHPISIPLFLFNVSNV